MKKVAITGGIGSGKSYVCKIFQNHFHIPIYYSDIHAKTFMLDKDVQDEVTVLLGSNAFIDGELNKPYIREVFYSNKEIKEQIDTIILNKLHKHFDDWCEQNKDEKYILFESAIIFEKKHENLFDKIITITVSDTIRKKRVFKRDNLTEREYQLVLNNQFSDDIKINKSDFVIDTSDISDDQLLKEITNINNEI